ncbi:MAG: choice-of-anchor D domain-containing protein, partial [Acidobacteriaceae bacterium]|nr:choice-of-anchor D domain-containing protein [Acidobacteriaceae bacterium]
MSYPPTPFGQVLVSGTTSQTLSFSFSGLSGRPSFSMHYGIEFTAGAVTCNSGWTSCSVPVTFSPKYPGVRTDAVTVNDSSNHFLGTMLVSGIGEGSRVAFLPGTSATVPQYANGSGIAIDTAGNLYVEYYNGVLETKANDGSVVQIPMSGAYLGLAVDGAGDVYAAGGSSNVIWKFSPATGAVTIVAGSNSGGYQGDGGPATSAALNNPVAICIDATGNLYIADNHNNVVRKVTAATGVITTIAGNGTAGYSGDGGQAASAQLNSPNSVAVDTQGNVFIADESNKRIRKVDPSGIITTYAGNGTGGSTGDGGIATAASLDFPATVAVDAAGDLFIGGSALRMVSTAGIINTVAQIGAASIALDPNGNLYAQAPGYFLTKVTASANPVSFSLTGLGQSSPSQNITLANEGNAALNVSSLSVGGLNPGDFGESNTCGTSLAGGTTCKLSLTFTPTLANSRSAVLTANDSAPDSPQTIFLSGFGIIAPSALALAQTPLGGTSAAQTATLQFPGSASSATLSLHYGSDFSIGSSSCLGNAPVTCTAHVTFHPKYAGLREDAIVMQDSSGNVLATMLLHGIGKGPWVMFSPPSRIVVPNIFMGNITASLVGFDMGGNAYYLGGGEEIFKQDASSGAIQLIAGGGTGGDGGLATTAAISPSKVVIDGAGDVYFAELYNYRVRRVDGTTGILTTVAGSMFPGYTGDSGPATSATFTPTDLAIDSSGNLYIADARASVVRKVSAATGVISTVAGIGVGGFSGDGGLATAAQLAYPSNITLDAAGNLYISDTGNLRIREVDGASGIITTIAGNGQSGSSGDGGSPLAAMLQSPGPLAVDLAGNVYFVDTGIRKISAARDTISTIPVRGYFFAPLFFDATGTLYAYDIFAGLSKLTGASINFTDSLGNPTTSQTIGFANIGNGPLTISAMTFSGANPSDFSQTNTCGTAVAAGSSCSVTVMFHAQQLGTRGGSLLIADNAPDSPQTVPLTGVGAPLLVGAPTALSFTTAFGTTQTQTVTLSNPNAIPVTISSIQVPRGNFTETNNCGSTVPGNSSCTVTITFAPTGTFSVNSSLTVLSNAPAVYTPLTGTGVPSSTPQTRVFIDSPGAQSAPYVGLAYFSGWAVSNTSQPAVRVFVDGAFVGTAFYGTQRRDVCAAFPVQVNCPFVGWFSQVDTTQLANGAHTLEVVATSSNGQHAATSRTFTVANWAPSSSNPMRIVIDSPNQGSNLKGTATFGGWAINDVTSVAAVAIGIDGSYLGRANYGVSRPDVCSAFPNRSGCPNVGWTFTFDTTQLSDGSHTLDVIAAPNGGGESTTVTTTFSVTNGGHSPVHVWIDVPNAQSGKLSGRVQFGGWAIDDNTSARISYVVVFIDNSVISDSVTYGAARPDVCNAFPNRTGCPNVGWTVNVDTTSLGNGPHTLEAFATGTDSVTAVTSTSFTVANSGSVNQGQLFLDVPGAFASTFEGT